MKNIGVTGFMILQTKADHDEAETSRVCAMLESVTTTLVDTHAEASSGVLGIVTK